MNQDKPVAGAKIRNEQRTEGASLLHLLLPNSYAAKPMSRRYNGRVHVKCSIAAVIVSAAMWAQSAPPSCPASRPVDDIITEIQKEQSKNKHRNTTPFPQVICSWGWCLDVSRMPPTFPESTSETKMPSNGNAISSPTADETCDEAMKIALQAAHNVEVGDYSFREKNYKGALLRYNEALEQKPEDLAIHVRVGRVLEKLKQVPEAIEQYKAAQKLAGPEQWSEEAKSALLRLQHNSGP